MVAKAKLNALQHLMDIISSTTFLQKSTRAISKRTLEDWLFDSSTTGRTHFANYIIFQVVYVNALSSDDVGTYATAH